MLIFKLNPNFESEQNLSGPIRPVLFYTILVELVSVFLILGNSEPLISSCQGVDDATNVDLDTCSVSTDE